MHTKEITLNDLFPEKGKVLLTGTGKEFVKRIGESVIKDAVLGVLRGENIRSQTEYLTRIRITQISAALITLYTRGHLTIPDFSDKIIGMAFLQLINSKKNANTLIWPAQWFIGLTGKSVQNVLKSDHKALLDYIKNFTESMKTAINKSAEDFGNIKVTMGFLEEFESGKTVELGWKELLQLSTAIGAQTLTIRGSDKSMYGKLFEKLILGTSLTILGFKRIDPPKDAAVLKNSGLFWLSDSSNERESDATVLYEPYKLARFDIGFIGPGNSEISKDKLSRFSSEQKYLNEQTYTKTFIIVDRLPTTGKTQRAAKLINADIIQMSMKYWPRELAAKMGAAIGLKHPLQSMREDAVAEYLANEMKGINILDFLNNFVIEQGRIEE